MLRQTTVSFRESSEWKMMERLPSMSALLRPVPLPKDVCYRLPHEAFRPINEV